MTEEESNDDVHLVQLLFKRAVGSTWVTVGAGTKARAIREAARAYRDMSDPETGNLAVGVRIRDIRLLSAEQPLAEPD